MIWVDAFKVGSLVSHPVYGDTVYDEAKLRQAVANFKILSDRGYSHTVLREHGSEDSYIYGDIADLRINDGYLQALVEFTRDEERDAYNDGLIREWSPGFAHQWLDPHTGETLENVLLEISFCARAYQRNLRDTRDINEGVKLNGPLHYAFGGQYYTGGFRMEDKEKLADEKESVEMAEESVDYAKATYEMVKEMVALMQPKEDMSDDEEKEEMSDDEEKSEMAALSAKVSELINDNRRLSLLSSGHDADSAERLVVLSAKLSDVEFKELVKFSAPKSNNIQPEVGVAGGVSVADQSSVSSIVKFAAQQGVTFGHGLTQWAVKNHPSRVADIINHAKSQRGK
jgi:hypothetical protein